MALLYPHRATLRRKLWGARLMAHDPFAVALALGATWWAWPWVGPLAAMPVVVVAHFLWFCNIVRMRRRLELLWSAALIVHSAIVLYALESPDVVWLLILQLPWSVALSALELRSPTYHGALAPRINPELNDYLDLRLAQARAPG